MVIILWSVGSFLVLWLLLLGFAALSAVTIRRLEQDDGPWRRGL